ncbi:hypothetical protein [Pseudonocardia sp. NPDC049154]|uniref:hypothetical protein n=1 Tax=Pseudonocardia sp. NPDC049154 TaxID=3155501 RepID=UPI0033EBDD2B
MYLGFTVAFGHSLIRWADVRFAHRFAHRFAGGPPPAPKPTGAARTAYEWREWTKVVVMALVTGVVLVLVSLAAGRAIPVPTAWGADPLWHWGLKAALVTGILFVAGPLRYSGRSRVDA